MMHAAHADQHRTAARAAPGARVLKALLIAVVLGEPLALQPAFAQSEVKQGSTKADSTPLAACRVTTAEPQPAPYSTIISGSLFIDNTPTDDPLLDYHPLLEPTGEESEQDAERVRVLITSPTAARVIDLRVRIDGEPFRDRRQAWVERLIAQSPAESQLRDAGRALQNAAAALGQAANINALAPEKTKTRRRETPTLRSRLANYLAAAGHQVDPSEITTLLNQWPTGPALTVLSPARSWQRAGDAPLLAVLDTDGDGGLSVGEVAGAADRLDQADIDQDGVVKLNELRRAARRRLRRRGGRLVTIVDPRGEWKRKLGRNATQLDLQRIATGPADLQLTVDFGKQSQVELYAAAGVQPEAIAVGQTALGIDFGPERYEIAAVQPADTSSEKIDQIAIGAAFDGRPLLRLLDADNDGRLTIQEQRRLPGLLAALDIDGDGALAVGEPPTPVRIVVGRGAIVHRPLGAPAPAVQAFEETVPRITAPAWFLPMDANSDGVLTRDEFPGDAQQFQSLDANGDGLISAAEAAGV